MQHHFCKALRFIRNLLSIFKIHIVSLLTVASFFVFNKFLKLAYCTLPALFVQEYYLNDQFWGKTPGTTRAGALVLSRDSLFEEAFSPHADDFATSVEAGCDLIVGQAIGSEKHLSGAHDLKIQ